MRRVVWIMAMVFVLGTAGTTHAQTVTLTAQLSGSNETPAPGVLTGAFGTAEVVVDLAAKSWSWVIDEFNMPSGTTAAHFHVGGVGLAGPVVANIPVPVNVSNDFRLTGSANALTSARPDQGIRSVDDFIQSMMGGAIYINIHSAVNPPGEIRGQLMPRP